MMILLLAIAIVGPFVAALLVRTLLPAPKPGVGLVLLLGLAGGIGGWLVGFLLGLKITPHAPAVPWLAGGAVVGGALLTWIVSSATSKHRVAAQQAGS